MASTRMRSGKLRFMDPIVGDEAGHGRARLAWWQHTGVGTTEGGQRNRAPASCRSGGAAARPPARAGEAEEGGAEAEVRVDARGAGVGQDADLGVDDVADSGKTLKMVMDLIDEHGLTLDGSAAVHVEARSAGFGLGLVLGAAFVPCAGPVLTSIIVASNSGQITWHIIGLAISFAIGVSIPLMIVAIAGSGVAARFLKTRQRPLRIAAGVAMIALALGIATDAPMALQRMIPDYTAALEVGTEGACEDGSCEPEKEVEASTDFAQCARDGAKDCGVMPTLQASQWLNTLGQPSGTVTLVDFWSSSCTNCQREIPKLEAIYEKYKSYGLVVVGVHSPQQAFERDASVVNASISKLGITYPVALDPDLEAFKAYGATAWPTHFIAGADGKLVATGRGTKGVEEIIRTLLSEAGQTLPD